MVSRTASGRNCRPIKLRRRKLQASGFWSRLLPFAAWVWVTNLLYNLFDVVDRYMIVHTARVADPLAEVGNYHSSRIVPLLLVSISTLMGTMLLPHLSHDWEAGRRGAVSARMNLALKLLGLLLFTGSIVILAGAAVVVRRGLQGKIRRRLGRLAVDADLLHVVRHGHDGANVFVVRGTGAAGLRGIADRPGHQRRAEHDSAAAIRIDRRSLGDRRGQCRGARVDLSLQHLDGNEAAALGDVGFAVADSRWVSVRGQRLRRLAAVALAAIFTDQLFDAEEKQRLTRALVGYRNRTA